MKPLHRERLDKTWSHRGRDHEETIGLVMVGGQLGEELVVRNARGRCWVSARISFGSFGDLCPRRDALKIFSHIEIRFVE